MKFSIIILNWNKPDLTIDCLKSVGKLQITNFKLEIIVVDNASSDDSIKKIQNSKFKIQNDNSKFKIIENPENLGFAEGNNVGIKAALENGSDFVIILNNDTEVDKNLVTGLLKTCESYPKAALISPKIYFAKGYEYHKGQYKDKDLGNVIWYAGGKIDWNNVYGENSGVDQVDKGQFDKISETDFATGCCMVCRTSALKKIGLFDKKYYLYMEDADLSQRMKNAGYQVLYSPKGFLWHKVAQSSGIGSNLNDYFITRNRLLFGFRYARLRTRFALYRESIRMLINGRPWQKKGILDFYLGKFDKGSWGN